MALLLLLLLFLGVVVQSTIETPSQHRSTTQACPKKGKQARAERAGIEPGTFRTKPVPPDHETKPLRSPEPPKSKKIEFVRACAVETHFKICGKYRAKRSRTPVDTSLCASLCRNAFNINKYHAKRSRTEVANSLCASLRSRNALRHQARARICGKYHAKRSRTERAPQSGTKAFSLTVTTP